MSDKKEKINSGPMPISRRVKNYQYFYRPIDKRLPMGPGTIFCGGTNTGKTNFMLDLICQPKYFRGYYKIFIFSKNIKKDSVWRSNIRIDEKYISTRFSETKIKKIIANQDKKIQEHFERHGNVKKIQPVLIILDDMIGEMNMIGRGTKLSFIERFACENRHSWVHIWISTQYYRAISKSCREQIADKFLFFSTDEPSNKDICAENGGKSALAFYNHATQEPHQCFHVVNYGPKETRFRKNLDTFMSFNEITGDVEEHRLVMGDTKAPIHEKETIVELNKKRKRKVHMLKHKTRYSLAGGTEFIDNVFIVDHTPELDLIENESDYDSE